MKVNFKKKKSPENKHWKKKWEVKFLAKTTRYKTATNYFICFVSCLLYLRLNLFNSKLIFALFLIFTTEFDFFAWSISAFPFCVKSCSSQELRTSEISIFSKERTKKVAKHKRSFPIVFSASKSNSSYFFLFDNIFSPSWRNKSKRCNLPGGKTMKTRSTMFFLQRACILQTHYSKFRRAYLKTRKTKSLQNSA